MKPGLEAIAVMAESTAGLDDLEKCRLWYMHEVATRGVGARSLTHVTWLLNGGFRGGGLIRFPAAALQMSVDQWADLLAGLRGAAAIRTRQ